MNYPNSYVGEQPLANLRKEAHQSNLPELFAHAPAAIALVEGPGLTYVFANPFYQQLFNRTNEQLLGKSVGEVFPEAEGQGINSVFKKVSQTGEPCTIKEFFVLSEQTSGTKSPGYYNFILQPIKEAEGHVSSIMIHAFEVTEQVKAKRSVVESEAKYRSLFDSIDEGFCIIEVLFGENEKAVDYRFLEVNRSFERQTGIKNGIGRRMREIVPEHEDYWFEIYGSIALTGISRRFENRAVQLSRWYSVYAFRIGEPEKRRVAVLFNDITERKLTEQALEAAVRERTIELQHANEALEEKNQALVSMNEELQAFSYAASHDLQEPLRKISTFCDIIKNTEGTNLSSRGAEYLARICKAGQRMQTLIEDLLGFARISSDDRTFESTDLGQLAATVITDFKENIEEKNAVVEMGPMCMLNIIPFQFRQLFQNLLSNALKFSSSERRPYITICSEVRNGSALAVKGLSRSKNYCHIRFSDNGIGIEPGAGEQIFKAFQRLHDKTAYPGTGIGLAIVKKIVKYHGGEIEATGELNKGTTFNIYIPTEG